MCILNFSIRLRQRSPGHMVWLGWFCGRGSLALHGMTLGTSCPLGFQFPRLYSDMAGEGQTKLRGSWQISAVCNSALEEENFDMPQSPSWERLSARTCRLQVPAHLLREHCTGTRYLFRPPHCPALALLLGHLLSPAAPGPTKLRARLTAQALLICSLSSLEGQKEGNRIVWSC